MTPFLTGFLIAWFLISAILLYIEETDTRRVSFLDLRVFVLLTAPATVPAMLLALAYRYLNGLYKKLKAKGVFKSTFI